MSFLTDHILSVLIFAPVAGAVLVALTRRENEGLQRLLGLLWSTGVFGLSLLLTRTMKPAAGIQFEEHVS
jgi:NADH:ubiquinone oxidoreductase subunit 4 (subunit M)